MHGQGGGGEGEVVIFVGAPHLLLAWGRSRASEGGWAALASLSGPALLTAGSGKDFGSLRCLSRNISRGCRSGDASGCVGTQCRARATPTCALSAISTPGRCPRRRDGVQPHF